MKNVKEAAAARAALGAYHPLWLRLGMEVVVGRSMAGDLMCCCMPCAACLVLHALCCAAAVAEVSFVPPCVACRGAGRQLLCMFWQLACKTCCCLTWLACRR